MAAAETERKTLQLQMLDLESEVIFEFEELEAELLHLRTATEEMGRQLKESEQKRCAPCDPWAAADQCPFYHDALIFNPHSIHSFCCFYCRGSGAGTSARLGAADTADVRRAAEPESECSNIQIPSALQSCQEGFRRLRLQLCILTRAAGHPRATAASCRCVSALVHQVIQHDKSTAAAFWPRRVSVLSSNHMELEPALVCAERLGSIASNISAMDMEVAT